MKKVYLAGFDVFYPDALQRGTRMKLLCAEFGLIGCYPFDNTCTDAAEIFRANCAMIDSCDLVAANLNAFRGAEPDSGTAFEVGYACARGKPVYGYLSDGRTMREKLGTADENGMTVEDFGLPVNLMLAHGATVVVGGLADALRQARADLDAGL